MKIWHYIVLLFISFVSFKKQGSAQIVINEFSASNATKLADEKGNYGDWIEFYNSGSSAVNLYNYQLSDDPLIPAKWRFPRVILPANGFLTVFADDANKSSYVDHWETAVKANDIWSYITPNSSTDTNWRNLNFSDLSWNKGKGGIGYGDGDDSTLISTVRAVYMRKKFTISDTSKIAKAIFNIDYDDGFVAYLNGIEIARNNLGVAGIPPGYDELAPQDHEAQMYELGQPDYFYLNDSLLRSAMRIGTNVLAVEVHNNTWFSSDLSAIPFLTFGVTYFNQIYGVPPAWFNAPPREYLHANFKLSKSGETILLSDSSGNILDQKFTGTMQTDISSGRTPDGGLTWCLFDTPTPSASNSTAQCFSGYAALPVFSISAGFYDTPRMLSLSAPQSNSIIRFTTDGSTPSDTSSIYVSSLALDTTQTVKARVYKTGLIPSSVVSNTYFIGEDLHLPVFSLTTNPENLWDDSTGIYVLGLNASPNYPYKGANYWQDWEKPVNVEYYDKQKTRAFQFDAAFKINGNYSRSKPQKSFEVLLDNDYGTPSITYPLIPEKQNIKSYDSFILRNAGTDWNKVHFRDGLMQRIMKNTYTGYLGYEPCEVFLNGAYWGVYEIRDNDNHSYVQNNFGYKKSEIDLIYEGGNIETKNGSDTGFFNMYNYAISANQADTAFYTKMNSVFDLQNFTDYFIAETYYINNDWIGDWSNNIKLWRPRTAGAKWKYILYDLDFGLGLYSSYSYDKLAELIAPADDCHQSDLFNAMVANPKFRNYFINRYADLINTIYKPSNISKVTYEMRDSIAADMPLQFARWGNSMTTWAQNISSLINFSNKRPAYAINQIVSNFNLTDKVILTLDAYPQGAGRIQISTIIPDSLPWKGTYFNGNPVTVTAIPNPGYTFDHWKPSTVISGLDSSQSLTLNFTSNDSVVAYFTGSVIQPRITISEINYQSADFADAGDWVELHNPDSIAIDLTGWKFRDNDDLHTYTLPLGAVIEANSYLVLVEDTLKFDSQFSAAYQNHHHHGDHRSDHSSYFNDSVYTVGEVYGPLGFGFTNTGELLRLYDYKDSLRLSMTYSKLPPWPISAAGQGYTLESINNNPDLDNGDNWFAGCLRGSPGTFYAPAIAVILADTVVPVCVGDSVLLAAQVGDNYLYQWYKNGMVLQNATNDKLLVADSGSYTVSIKRIGCESISQPVKVIVNSLPLIQLNSPLSLVVCAGSSQNILVDSLSGQSFEWFKNDTLLGGQLSSQLAVSDSGLYKVRVTQNGCSSFSPLIAVGVNPVPNASLQHDSLFEFCEGLAQQLSAPLINGYTYRWFKNDTLLASADSVHFAAVEAGAYTFETSLNGCSAISDPIHIILDPAPKTLLFSSDTMVLCLGETHNLVAFYDSSYTYEWFKNDTLLVGADSAQLEVDETAKYTLRTTNATCSAQKDVIVLLNPSPVAVLETDSAVSTCAGTSYQLKVNRGLGYTYQWMMDSLAIPGATSFKYNASVAGDYYAIIRLSGCSSSSASTRLSIYTLPQNSILASDTTVFCEGGFVALNSIQQSGYFYQWYKNGVALLGQTDSVYMATSSGNYTVVQQDSLCSNLSNTIAVTVKPTPPTSLTLSGATHLCFGDSIIFSVLPYSSATYSWYLNNQLLTETSSQLLAHDSGYYFVQVMADACVAFSDTINITQNPQLMASILSPDSSSICLGSTYPFSAATAPNLTYQWFYNSAAIPFATASTYNAVTPGNYSLEVADANCAARSSIKRIYNFTPTVVSLAAFNSMCIQDSAFTLTGGLPVGGSYGGNGVAASVFVPSIAGVGANTVNYTFVDSNQCTSTAISVIEIKANVASPVVSQNFNMLLSSAASNNQWYYNDTLIVGATQQSYIPTQNGVYSVVVNDSVLCASLPVYYNYLSLGTTAEVLPLAASVYPNPGNGEFSISLPDLSQELVEVTVFDVLGQTVLYQTGKAQSFAGTKLSVRGVKSGVYLLKVKSGKYAFQEKLIISQ